MTDVNTFLSFFVTALLIIAQSLVELCSILVHDAFGETASVQHLNPPIDVRL